LIRHLGVFFPPHLNKITWLKNHCIVKIRNLFIGLAVDMIIQTPLIDSICEYNLVYMGRRNEWVLLC
jgi:hypothetical protein